MKDVDARAGRGSGFGEMQARTLKRLGCVGVLAGVGLHDVDAIRSQKFPAWATSISPAHGPYHVVPFGGPVVIGNVTWRSGDVIVADASGAIRIPSQIASDVVRRAADLAKKDRDYFAVVDAADFSFAKLRAWMAGHQSIYPPVDPAAAADWWARNGARLESGTSRPDRT
jgi:regulator of RNase E activity RraA